jgi:hypothetical protein
MILFYFIPNVYEYVLSLFKNMLTAVLPHTAAPLGSRTLPRALPDNRTLPHTLPHTAALPDTAVRLAAHCCTLRTNSNAGQPYTACCTAQTITHSNKHELE